MATFKGITFFDFNYALQEFQGDVSVSSNDETKWLAFDGNKNTRWQSSGEDTDGNAVFIERDFETNREIKALFIYNTNILNIAFEFYDGSWNNITDGVNATITKTADNKYIYVLLDAKTTMSRIRISGSNTIVTNEEKYVFDVYAFDLIGTLEYPIDPNPTEQVNETIFKKEDSKNIVITKGNSFDFSLAIKSHINQNDIDLLETLKDRATEFYIWINAGVEGQFDYSFEPYRFRDIYKVARVRGGSPSLTKNLYWTGLNDALRLIEVS